MLQHQNLDLWCLVEGDSTCFIVKVISDEDIRVADLKERVHEKKERGIFRDVDAAHLVLWKLKDPVPIKPKNTFTQRIPPLGADSYVELDDETETLSVLFVNPPGSHLHIVVQFTPVDRHVSKRARFGIPISEDQYQKAQGAVMSRTASKKHFIKEKKWTVNGAISDGEPYYYVNLRTQAETKRCLDSIQKHNFLLLTGSRASGKTTRLFCIRSQLAKIGVRSLYISFEGLSYADGAASFWDSFRRAAMKDALRCGFPCSLPMISSQRDFLDAFHANVWPYEFVLILDELSELHSAPADVRNQCLRAFREIKTNRREYAVSSILAAGTFSIVHLNPTDGISNHVQNPYFTLEETAALFQEFAMDNCINVEDDVIQDVWARSSGHPGMVCLCGRAIASSIQLLLDHDTLSYQNWINFSVTRLYQEMYGYNAFRSMVESLRRPEAEDAVDLLRFRFLGFPGDVTVFDEEEDLADFLTSQGILLRPDPVSPTYRMTSALVDGLIRRKVIAYKFRSAPPTEPPFDHSRQSLNILSALTESLKCFDKQLIRLAPSRAYKLLKVEVNGSRNTQVPRESVYDTELMRILSNWLRTHHGWTVTGQWHLKAPLRKHKYTDIVLRKDGNPPTVLELLATGDRNFVNLQIDKTPKYMALLKAKEAWVIHFTREDNYDPVWQSDAALNNGVNLVHICHNSEFTEVLMMARWKDSAGITHLDKQTISI